MEKKKYACNKEYTEPDTCAECLGNCFCELSRKKTSFRRKSFLFSDDSDIDEPLDFNKDLAGGGAPNCRCRGPKQESEFAPKKGASTKCQTDNASAKSCCKSEKPYDDRQKEPSCSKKTEQPKNSCCSKKTEQPKSPCCSKKTEEPKNSCYSKKTEEPKNSCYSKKTEEPKSSFCSNKTEQPKNSCCSKKTEKPKNSCCSKKTEEPKNSCCSKKTEEPKNGSQKKSKDAGCNPSPKKKPECRNYQSHFAENSKSLSCVPDPTDTADSDTSSVIKNDSEENLASNSCDVETEEIDLAAEIDAICKICDLKCHKPSGAALNNNCNNNKNYNNNKSNNINNCNSNNSYNNNSNSNNNNNSNDVCTVTIGLEKSRLKDCCRKKSFESKGSRDSKSSQVDNQIVNKPCCSGCKCGTIKKNNNSRNDSTIKKNGNSRNDSTIKKNGNSRNDSTINKEDVKDAATTAGNGQIPEAPKQKKKKKGLWAKIKKCLARRKKKKDKEKGEADPKDTKKDNGTHDPK